MKKHLAIFTGDLAEEILIGVKTIESRFSKAKIAPFGLVSAGDIVYIKPTGKDIVGQFEVDKVIFYDGLTVPDVEKIRLEYGDKIAADREFWKGKRGSKYASLIFIKQSTRFLVSPVKIEKKDQRGWMTLD